MANKQKNNSKNQSRVTIANIIAIVGLVLLLVFTFIGHSYMSGGEIGWDIIIAVLVTAIAGGLLWFMIKCKGAPNQLDKWKKIELATLVCYILIAIPASLFGGIMHFFVVNDNKEQIKGYAQEDIAQIDSLFSAYKAFENNAISNTKTGLLNATGMQQICDNKLNQFMQANNIAHTHDAANTFCRIQSTNLVGTAYDTFKQTFDNRKNNISTIIDSWSVMQVPFKAKEIETLATEVGEQLTLRSKSAKLPKLTFDPSINKHTIKQDNQAKEFSIDVSSFRFRKALQNANGFSVTALIIVLLIHLMILFNYCVARRTNVIGVGDSGLEEDGGQQL